MISQAVLADNRISFVRGGLPVASPRPAQGLKLGITLPILHVQRQAIQHTGGIQMARFIPVALTVVGVLATAIVAVGPWMWG
jgi:hypothetical protein